MAVIRKYQEGDFGDIVEICKLTAHPSIKSSADILPYIYAVPYIRLEPAHAFILDAGSLENASGSGSGRRVVGYIIGTPDTKTFVERYRKEYLPTLTLPSAIANITATTDTSATAQADDGNELRRMFERILLNPEEMLQPAVPDFIPCYPAHLHIDILPEFQGKGFGGRLMEIFLSGVRACGGGGGACGVHLGMRRDNVAAGRFYKRCGFRVHEGLSDEHTTWMVKDLGEGEGGGGGGERGDEKSRVGKIEQGGERREGDIGCGASK